MIPLTWEVRLARLLSAPDASESTGKEGSYCAGWGGGPDHRGDAALLIPQRRREESGVQKILEGVT